MIYGIILWALSLTCACLGKKYGNKIFMMAGSVLVVILTIMLAVSIWMN